jgi:hypothetical protein
MKKPLILFLIILLSGCGPNEKTKLLWYCTCEEMDQVQEFIKESIGPSNNMSDEEMEDVIEELAKVAMLTSCHQEKTITTLDGNAIIERLKLDSCETYIGWIGL